MARRPSKASHAQGWAKRRERYGPRGCAQFAGQPVTSKAAVEARSVVMATLSTANFEFMTIADTDEQAKELMRKAWQTHRERTGAIYRWREMSEDVSIKTVTVGQAYRDGEPMTVSDGPFIDDDDDA